MTRKIRVGINARVFLDWGGGVDLIIYIANAIALNPKNRVFFIVPDSAKGLNVRLVKGPESNSAGYGASERFAQIFRKLDYISDVREIDPSLSDLAHNIKIVRYKNQLSDFIYTFKKLRLDVVVPTTASFGLGFPLPWIGYIWDFQHKHLAKYFSQEEINGRETAFKNTLDEAPAILVNSQSTKIDIGRYYPKYKNSNKIFVMPFSPYPMKSWLSTSSNNILNKYDLPKRFFIVSNQFWLHKSHQTAIKAMSYLQKLDSQIHLVCTGKMEEPRNPNHIKKLERMIKTLNLQNKIHLLGLIPKKDQIALLRNSIGLVQPTLYEGGPGGGSSYNAVALGVPVIASNIPTNLEMGRTSAHYFKAGSAKDLSKVMHKVSKLPIIKPPNSILMSEGNERLKMLSALIEDAMNAAIDNYRAKK